MPWTLIAAAGLVSIPVLIHIFNRTRYRRIQWAAMDFLLAAYKRTRRRMQFEH
ncbi:MAG: BatA domain-containing protein [Planctomycetes bacterium]|nr:BatA domain-containing protein [Planctomycetota bacterium]